MNLPGTAEALKNAEKTVENYTTISIFLLPVKWLFVLELPIFYESDNDRED